MTKKYKHLCGLQGIFRGKRCQRPEDGALWTGWRTIDGARYYFYPDSGKCAINIAMPVDGYWYLFGTDGKIQTGFQNVNGSTYYFDPSNGVMVAGTSRTIDGVVYTFQADGTCTTQVATANSYNFNSGSNSQNGSGTSNTPNSGESNPEADGGKTGVITAGSSR